MISRVGFESLQDDQGRDSMPSVATSQSCALFVAATFMDDELVTKPFDCPVSHDDT